MLHKHSLMELFIVITLNGNGFLLLLSLVMYVFLAYKFTHGGGMYCIIDELLPNAFISFLYLKMIVLCLRK